MPSEETKILAFNQYQKSDKACRFWVYNRLLDAKIILKIHLQQK